jgi:hypothetical protein
MIEVYDIETLSNCFTYCGLDINTKNKSKFIIHKDKNDLINFVKHLKNCKGQIGFNNLSFDAQVIEEIIKNSDKWSDKCGEEIAKLIYGISQSTIENSNNGSWPKYPEWKLTIPQIDLFKIWHFDNRAKLTSLKWIEYAIEMYDIQDMPIKHTEEVTIEQVNESIIPYNEHDVLSTYELYKITKGDTEHPLYKGIDKIQLRKDIKKEFGINCLNYNDVKIGDEINKLSYCKLANIDKKDLPKPNKEVKSFKFKDCFPDYMKFESLEFNNFIKTISNVVVDLKKKQSFEFTYNSTTYIIAKGGLHSKDKSRVISSNENEILRDADVGLIQWPN